jgi:four helix bundle protein
MNGWNNEEEMGWMGSLTGVLEAPQTPYGGSNDSRVQFIRKLKKRTKVAATEIVDLMEKAGASPALNVIRYQVIKSANYRAACRARSQKEFFAKIITVVEETDETLSWLEMLFDSKIKIDTDAVTVLGKEWQEILKIMATSRKNSRRT